MARIPTTEFSYLCQITLVLLLLLLLLLSLSLLLLLPYSITIALLLLLLFYHCVYAVCSARVFFRSRPTQTSVGRPYERERAREDDGPNETLGERKNERQIISNSNNAIEIVVTLK